MTGRIIFFLCFLLGSHESSLAAKHGDSPKDQGVVVVKKGENLLDVARRCGVSTDDLIRNNGLLRPYKIYIGQPLIYTKSGKPEPIQHVKNLKQVERLPAKKPTTPKEMPAATKPQPARNYYVEEIAAMHKASRAAELSPETREATPTDLKRTGKHFSWPLKGKVLSNFGKKKKGINDGINIEAKFHSSVKAAEDGIVAYAGNEIRGYGNMVLLNHAGGWTTVYAHNDILLVNKGDRVKRGQEIAKSGNTGHVDTPQVHFEIRNKADPVDPIKYLK